MSHDPQEFQIPVIFDVTAYSREEAGDALVKILGGHRLPGNRLLPHHQAPHIESWWTVEHVDKGHDGNDNEHGVVVFQHDLDYLLGVLDLLDLDDPEDVSPEQRERHKRLLSYFAPDNRIGTDDDRDEDGY